MISKFNNEDINNIYSISTDIYKGDAYLTWFDNEQGLSRFTPVVGNPLTSLEVTYEEIN